MPASRAQKQVMRGSKKPSSNCVDDNSGAGKSDGTSKQYKQTGKKYSGPNYPDKDPNIVYTKEI